MTYPLDLLLAQPVGCDSPQKFLGGVEEPERQAGQIRDYLQKTECKKNKATWVFSPKKISIRLKI